MRRSMMLVGLALMVAAGALQAQDPRGGAADPAQIVDLDAMTVRGVQPGPGLWKVHHGEHVLWILGTVAPLPRDMQWQSGEVEAVIAQSQQVLRSPTLMFDADVGFFGKLALAPSALKAMRNADGARLVDVLPPDLYARWSRLKQRYIGRDGGVEKKRPMIAAGELYQAAIRRSGLARKPVIAPVVERAAKQAGITLTDTSLTFHIKDPKAAIREFREGGIDDIACFRSMLGVVEHDLPAMVEHANAWAVGDIDVLLQATREDPGRVCGDALSATAFAKKRGYGDLGERMAQHWMQIATDALERNRSTFAVLPVSELLGGRGYLERLRARGYVIEAP